MKTAGLSLRLTGIRRAVLFNCDNLLQLEIMAGEIKFSGENIDIR